MPRIKGKIETIILVSVLTLSLVVSAFAHRAMPMSDAGSNPALELAGIDLEAFRLPDGSLPSFCFHTGDGSSAPLIDNCDFCTLAHGVDIPEGVAIPLLATSGDYSNRAIRAHITALGFFNPGTPSTGPPVFS